MRKSFTSSSIQNRESDSSSTVGIQQTGHSMSIIETASSKNLNIILSADKPGWQLHRPSSLETQALQDKLNAVTPKVCNIDPLDC